MNPYRDLPEGVTPHDCEKPNLRCDDCGAEVSGGDEPCQSCVERYEDAETAKDLRQKHMAQTMDFVNKALLGRKETQAMGEAITEVVPQSVVKMAEALENDKIVVGGVRVGKTWAMEIAKAKPTNELLQKTQQLKDCIRESLERLDDNAPGKAREALRKGLGYGS